jgi:eukaryotic-like serine/threonine-protein kinase
MNCAAVPVSTRRAPRRRATSPFAGVVVSRRLRARGGVATLGELDPESDPQAAERVGIVLNEKWTLERLVGVGGMAAVYAGRHRNGARAAVKVLHPELARHKEVRERFQREGYAANRVDHPGVVKVLDDDVVATGADAGTAYLVMELLQGESLQDRLERGFVLGERDFLDLAVQVLDVLQVAHERGVVHRDLKPENLFYARDEAEPGKTRVKVLDFGLARLLDTQAITTYGLALGTPSFMSPEQAGGRVDEIDGRTDLFALAATGFRLRAGRRIHEADSPIEVVAMMARLPAPRIGTIVPDVSPPYARIIDRALEFKREDRYGTAAAMRTDVERALAELGAGAQRVRLSPVPPPSAPPPSARRPARTPPGVQAQDRTIEISASDLERRPAYGMDESIRIPKRGSLLPWFALLLVAGAGFAVWQDPARRSAVLEAVQGWREPIAGRARSSDAVAGSTAPADLSERGAADAGEVRPSPGGTTRSTATPAIPGSTTHRATPKPGASSPPRRVSAGEP